MELEEFARGPAKAHPSAHTRWWGRTSRSAGTPYHIRAWSSMTIHIPPTSELPLPILEVVPLQLLAYHIAVRRGCDVDQPRNLAKSVTVE